MLRVYSQRPEEEAVTTRMRRLNRRGTEEHMSHHAAINYRDQGNDGFTVGPQVVNYVSF